MSLRLPYNNSGATIFNLTLVDKYIGTIAIGLTYSIQFSKNTSSTVRSVTVIDGSSYPDTYNQFSMTTITGGTGSNAITNAKLEQGWYKYEVYTDADSVTKANCLELGQCYVYDNDEVAGNIPDNTETYVETKDKYVYNRS